MAKKQSTKQRSGFVTVRLKVEVRDKLKEIGWKDESYSDVVARLIEAAEKK